MSDIPVPDAAAEHGARFR